VNYAHLLQMLQHQGFTAGGFQPMAHGTGRAPGAALDSMLKGSGALGNPADLHRMTRRMAAGGNGLLQLLSPR
jgi:hypothetical protein